VPSYCDSLPSPTDLVGAPLTSADDYDCQPAYAAGYHGDAYRVDPALAERVRRLEAERAARDAARRAEGQARRVEAAKALTARPIGPGTWFVTGGAEAHHVDLTAEGAAGPRCDCGDALYRPEYACKHVLAAEMAAAASRAVRRAVRRVA